MNAKVSQVEKTCGRGFLNEESLYETKINLNSLSLSVSNSSKMLKQTSYTNLSNYFISLSNETGNLLTNLKLQKLLYYAQAWHLAYFEVRLVEGDFEAWVHGPVLPPAYQMFKRFAWKPIEVDELDKTFIDEFCSNTVTPKQCEILDDVINEYFGLTAYELEKLTHLEKPWQLARTGLTSDEPSNNIISDQSMIDYYQEFVVRG